MIGTGGWSIQNLLQAHNLAIIFLFIGALLFLGIVTLSFHGAVVV
jgi:hypothetical protein